MKQNSFAVFLSVFLCLLFASCSNNVMQEKSDDFWVGGKETELLVSAANFPSVFPELYRDITFDTDDSTQRAISKTVSGTSGNLYYEAALVFPKEADNAAIPYREMLIGSFEMYGGKPGHMVAWDVTFGQTKEEAEAAIKQYFNLDSLQDAQSFEMFGNFEMTEKKLFAMGAGGAESEVKTVQYSVQYGTLIVSYFKDEVRGMAFHIGYANFGQ